MKTESPIFLSKDVDDMLNSRSTLNRRIKNEILNPTNI